MNIGVAGVGKMGAAIAERLMEVGHRVTVWNRSSDKTKPLAAAGAMVAATPAELAAQSEAVITILTDAAAIDAVYAGPPDLGEEAIRPLRELAEPLDDASKVLDYLELQSKVDAWFPAVFDAWFPACVAMSPPLVAWSPCSSAWSPW